MSHATIGGSISSITPAAPGAARSARSVNPAKAAPISLPSIMTNAPRVCGWRPRERNAHHRPPLTRHFPYILQIWGNRITVPMPRKLHPFRCHPMARSRALKAPTNVRLMQWLAPTRMHLRRRNGGFGYRLMSGQETKFGPCHHYVRFAPDSRHLEGLIGEISSQMCRLGQPLGLEHNSW